MTPAELAALKQEIANTESTVLNLRAHAANLSKEADATEKHLAALKAKLPKP